MVKFPNWIKNVYSDPFKRYLILVLLIIGLFLIFKGDASVSDISGDGLVVHYFFHPECSHCKEQKPFNEYLMGAYPSVTFVSHDISEPKESALLQDFAVERGIPVSSLGVPATFFGDYHNIGFLSAATTGKEIENALKNFISGQESKIESTGQETSLKKTLAIPFLGEINVLDYSLTFLAVVLGLVDGFNPCAMWVLVYLISLILSINDRRKIWILVGSFVFASGVLYFLFMTAWLNVFLFIGYLRPLTIIIGLGAIGVGIDNLYTYFRTKGALTCDIGDEGSKKKTMGRMQKLVMSPITWASVFGIIALAFVVNSIEFACSSAIPAVFTQVLAISNLSTWQYYGYILLYDIFFMLDDLIIFSLAAFAVSTSIGNKYAKYCKLIGGVVLLGLGILLAFAPQVLR